MTACPYCREDHQDFQTVQRALEILAIKEYRVSCKRAARRWLEAVYEAMVIALPTPLETGTIYAAAGWVEKEHGEHAVALRKVADKVERARKR